MGCWSGGICVAGCFNGVPCTLFTFIIVDFCQNVSTILQLSWSWLVYWCLFLKPITSPMLVAIVVHPSPPQKKRKIGLQGLPRWCKRGQHSLHQGRRRQGAGFRVQKWQPQYATVEVLRDDLFEGGQLWVIMAIIMGHIFDICSIFNFDSSVTCHTTQAWCHWSMTSSTAAKLQMLSTEK